jgi:hypothetical protein
MMRHVMERVGGLSEDERGAVMGLLGGGAEPAVAAAAAVRLAGPVGARCLEAVRELALLPGAGHQAWMAALAGAAEAEGPSLDELRIRGARLVGQALLGAPADVVARAAAGVGEPLARVVLAAAVTTASAPERDQARALVAAVPADEARAGLALAVGLRALARELAARSPAARAAAAQRLPPEAAAVVLAGEG